MAKQIHKSSKQPIYHSENVFKRHHKADSFWKPKQAKPAPVVVLYKAPAST